MFEILLIFMIGLRSFVIGLLLLGLITSAGPTPRCKENFYYHTLPLIADESAILKLDSLFDGYNLDYSLSGADEWKDYLKLGQKMHLNKQETPQVPLLGIKTHHLQRLANSWGPSFIALAERAEKSIIHYGFLAKNDSAPVINNAITVESFENTTCFDAVMFPIQNVIIVDCSVELAKPNSQGFHYINQFYYFRISDGEKIKVIENDMFIRFKKMSKRQMQIYSDLSNSHTFLLRSYLYDGVDEQNVGNTYVDVFMISEPLEPWIVAVIDRSFLGFNSLQVAQIEVYLEEIYILNYAKGLHRLRINTEQDILYNGFYEGKGFTKFSVFSNNLDDKFQLSVANSHSVYEIDWSNIEEPILLNKYSLMTNSTISQAFLNERFVVVQASSTDSGSTYNYTWIMNRGDRTYTHAFKVIKHSTSNVRIDFNLDQSFILIFDNEKIINYALDQANLVLKLKKDQDFLDRLMSFTIKAHSIEPSTNKTVDCSMILNFTLLEDNNRTMWPIGAAPSSHYNANYPGKVIIPLQEYVLGPNITYRITETSKGQLKKYKVYQQEQLQIKWEVQPENIENISFLKTETINRADTSQDILIMYLQDPDNYTQYCMCKPNHKSHQMYCNTTYGKTLEGQIQSWATTLFLSRYTLKMHHVIAYTTNKHHNRIYLDDASTTESIIEIDLGKGYQGNITGLQVFGKYMFVILKYVKTVQVYDLELVVQGIDQPICLITHLVMYRLGVKYFSPEHAKTSAFFPNVIFIKTTDTIVVLDMNRQCVPKLLGILRPVASTEQKFNFQISRTHLIVTIMPNHVIEYDLSRVYLKDIPMTKKYPLYGYKLPKNYDTDVSQFGKSVYITMLNQAGDYEVFVYQAGLPAVASLYDVIDLYTYDSILVDASGLGIDYVSVYSAGELRVFRQYQTPLAQIYNPSKSYNFYLQYFNLANAIKLQLINVSIINLPTNISVNPTVNDIMKTKDLLFSGIGTVSEINDTNWYDGSILTIQSDCRDCKTDTIQLKNHIHKEDTINLFPGLVQYDWGSSGGSILAYDLLLNLHHHGKVRDIVFFPENQDTICLSATIPYSSKFSVAACVEGQGVNLYLTSLISHKGFAFSPYSSKAEQLLKIEATHELLILVDTSNNPFFKSRPGGVILYALNYDLSEDEAFEEIEYIDSNDFQIDGSLYVVNADLTYHPETKTYRLYITDIVKGLFEMEFEYTGGDGKGPKGISVLETNYINVPSMLSKSGSTPPYDATYQAVKLLQTDVDFTLKRYKDLVAVTTGVYHTILFNIVYDFDGSLISSQIWKFLNRYAYYDVDNDIRYTNGLLILKQILPQDYEDIVPNPKPKSKQLVTIYDTRAMPFGKKYSLLGSIPEIGLIGAVIIPDRIQRTYEFNLTYNSSDNQHQQPRVNMVLIKQFQNTIDQLSLHRNLTVITKQEVETQIIYLDLINDFDLKKIRILINGYGPFPQWKLILIILFSIIGFLILVAALLLVIKRVRQNRGTYQSDDQPKQDIKPEKEGIRQSLMTDSSGRGQDTYTSSIISNTPKITQESRRDSSLSSLYSSNLRQQSNYSTIKKPQPQYGLRKPEKDYGFKKPEPEYGFKKPQPEYGFKKPEPEYGFKKTEPEYGFKKPQPQYGFKKTEVENDIKPSSEYGIKKPYQSRYTSGNGPSETFGKKYNWDESSDGQSKNKEKAKEDIFSSSYNQSLYGDKKKGTYESYYDDDY